MIYTASYFEPHRHHGKRLSISRSIPAGFQVEGRLEFLIPHADLLKAWKTKWINETEYTNRYREHNKRPRRKQRGIVTLFLTFHTPQGAGNLPVILLK